MDPRFDSFKSHIVSDSIEDECPHCAESLVQLESIDDDAEAVGIRMVKTNDRDFFDRYGIAIGEAADSDLPAVVYFERESQNPSFYRSEGGGEGGVNEEDPSELLTWLLYQMKEDTIDNINRDLLAKMIEQHEFLAVFFCK